MIDRAYTVAEIDRLRNACRERYLFGTTDRSAQSNNSRCFGEQDMHVAVEEMVRTYMMAGITSEAIRAEDRAWAADRS